MIVVAAALINPDNAILIQQRPASKADAHAWEFPGGKVEPGESCRLALARELAEELGIAVTPDDLEEFTFVTRQKTGHADLLLLLYLCRSWTGEPSALDAARLEWVAADRLLTYSLLPLDRPLAERLIDYLAA